MTLTSELKCMVGPNLLSTFANVYTMRKFVLQLTFNVQQYLINFS